MKPEVVPVEVKPEFDLFHYLDLSGETRLEQALLGKLEECWGEWLPHLKAFELRQPKGSDQKSCLLVYLDQPVEAAVEAIWQSSPSDGLSCHNLAVAMVMAAAADLIPELAEGGCAPLPEPDGPTQKALKKMKLAWKDEGTLNRQYAVLTPRPYAGGCNICYLQEKCPRSQTRS
jgi:hypothetical protein